MADILKISVSNKFWYKGFLQDSDYKYRVKIVKFKLGIQYGGQNFQKSTEIMYEQLKKLFVSSTSILFEQSCYQNVTEMSF